MEPNGRTKENEDKSLQGFLEWIQIKPWTKFEGNRTVGSKVMDNRVEAEAVVEERQAELWKSVSL